MYATAVDMRDEGVSTGQASNTRLTGLLEEASQTIDRITGWYFEPRSRTYRLSGRGSKSLDLPVPPISITSITVDESPIPMSALHITGAPVELARSCDPHMTLRHGTFPKGEGNVVISGLWGFTEMDGTPEGRTPLQIRRACMLIAMRFLPRLGDHLASTDALRRWRVTATKRKDTTTRIDLTGESDELTGDPEADRILRRYVRPIRLGAA